MSPEGHTAARGKAGKAESEREQDIAQAALAGGGALLIGALYAALPTGVALGPRWLLLVVELALVVPQLLWAALRPRPLPFAVARGRAMVLLAVVTAALVGSMGLLFASLSRLTNGAVLLRPAALLWAINVLVFATWYWEVDGGGPRVRHLRHHEAADFQFPQQLGGNTSHWAPGFVDYVFLAFCFATALSPADTPPLTRRGKLLMMAEAVISLLIVVVLVARSINVLQ